MPSEKEEPVFSMQEQAIVYLFSRYWEELEKFAGKKITRIHTHFPDFAFETTERQKEGIEFEYGLSAFCSHMNGDLQKLKKLEIRRLYVVYWDRDCDEAVFEKAMTAGGITSNFICLKDYFRAGVAAGLEGRPWRPFWTRSNVSSKEAYPLEKITRGADKLIRDRAVTRLSIDENSQIFRTLGWDKKGSDFIECDHWEKIHFFTTTTPMDANRLPSKLFIKPNGGDSFIGFFDMKMAFGRKGMFLL
jgi:hypothetical protein